MVTVAVCGSFDDLRSQQVRFLEEAARLGSVHVLLWPDEMVLAKTGSPPKFPQAEREYVVRGLRYVDDLSIISGAAEPDMLSSIERLQPGIWAVDEAGNSPLSHSFCQSAGIRYHVVTGAALAGFPDPGPLAGAAGPRKRVIVTGCYDWLHSGHVRFFEEVSALGDLYVGVGNDANVTLLKGPGHPLFKQDERRYMVQAVRFVTRAFVSSGDGWMDAAPEIPIIRPDIYAVNEDGDKPEKRAFCAENGLEYVVLKRLPKEGLPRRQSTDLRGF
jgi:cytidyltransferase-like protein